MKMKRLIWMFLTALVLLVMTACGTADTEEHANGTDEGNGSSEVVEETDQEGTDDGDQAEETDPELIKEEAAFVGMIDNHSIEVNTETETIVLQTLEVEDVDFGEIEENAHVLIEYFKNDDGQNVLTNIEIK